MDKYGEQLTQLTIDNRCYSPSWSADGEKFICTFSFGTGQSSQTNGALFTSNGIFLDTIPHYCGGLTLLSGNNKCASMRSEYSNHSITIFDLVAGAEKKIATIEGPGGTGMTWIGEEYIAWSTYEGVFIVNVISLEKIKIKSTCNARYYADLQYSKTLHKFMFLKVNKELVDNTIYFSTNLGLMNINGSGEETIEIPE